METGTVTLTSQSEAPDRQGGEAAKEAGGMGKRLEGWGRGWRGGEEAGGVGKRLEGWERGWRGGKEDGRVGKRMEGWEEAGGNTTRSSPRAEHDEV